MVTEIQRKTIEALGTQNENFYVAADKLGISQKAMISRVSEIFEDFGETVNIVNDNFPIFARRMREHPEIYSALRSIARKMRKE